MLKTEHLDHLMTLSVPFFFGFNIKKVYIRSNNNPLLGMTMATYKRNYNMTETTDKWVKLRGNGSVYASESEYIRALIIRDMEQHGETELIRAAIMKGENSGISDKTPEEIKQAVLKRKQIV